MTTAAAMKSGGAHQRADEPACAPGCGVHPDTWFPLNEDRPALEALVLCAGCPVHRGCLAEALARPVMGIWAGTITGDRVRGRAALRLGVNPELVSDRLLVLAHHRLCATPGEPAQWWRHGQEPVAS